jgi:hypothetical protein
MDDKLRAVVVASLGYQASATWFEIGNNCASPHMDAELEMKEGQLTDAIAAYVIDRNIDGQGS